MTSLIGNIVKNTTDIDDEIILTNMLATSKGTATAYFGAAMSSITPELRAMLSTTLTQIMNGHSALTELAVKHGWERPYNTAAQQLSDVYTHSVAQQQ